MSNAKYTAIRQSLEEQLIEHLKFMPEKKEIFKRKEEKVTIEDILSRIETLSNRADRILCSILLSLAEMEEIQKEHSNV